MRAVFGGSMTRPSSRSFQAISSGIGLSSAHAALAIIAATTAKADFGNAIPDAALRFLAFCG